MTRKFTYLCAAVLSILLLASTRVVAASADPIIYLEEGRALLSRFLGSDAAVAPLSSGQATGLALASADFDHDGVADLATGYVATDGSGLIALHRGNLDAFAPQSQASFDAIARGDFGSPFLNQTRVIAAPARPDLLATGDYFGQAQTSLVVAAKGGTSLTLFSGATLDTFAQRQSIDTPGSITAIATYRQRPGDSFPQLAVGVQTQNGPALLVYTGSADGLTLTGTYRLYSAASSFGIGDLDRDGVPDVAIVGGGDVYAVYGRDLDSSSSIQPERLALNFPVADIKLGVYVRDQNRGIQIAALATDGSVHFLARQGFNAGALTVVQRAAKAKAEFGRPQDAVQSKTARTAVQTGWIDVETVSGIAPTSGSGPAPILLRSRISSNSLDDVMILNALGKLVVIAHPDEGGSADSFPPAQVLTRPQADPMVAAVGARVNIDGREGVLALPQGKVNPVVMAPLPDPTFIVNTTNDTLSAGACAAATANQCSLRQAIIEANAVPGTDTIMIPAGTYTLTLTGANKETAGETANYGSLNITDSVNIVGAGSATTIIQAGTNNSNGIDKVFSLNPNGAAANNFSIAGVTIRYGKNAGSFSGGLILPHGFGGGLFWEASNLLNASGNLTITNSVISDNSTVDGDGGGIAVDDAANGTGVFTMSNTVVQNNSVNEATSGGPGLGGGVWAGSTTAIAFTNVQILNNNATQVVSGNGGQGGGLFLFNPHNTNNASVIHASTFTGNHSAGAGGGIYTLQGLLIDQSSVINNNTASQGAGIFNNLSGETTTLSKVTINGNTATGLGGGIFNGTTGSTTSGLVVNFSRLAGNSASSGKNLASQAGTNSAANNWWGVNAPAGTISGSVTFTPYITVAATAAPAKVRINQSSTVTGDMSKDSNSTGIALPNLTQIIGIPITFNNAILGTIPELQPEAIGSSATATATFNAGGASGNGSVDVVVDQQTTTLSIAVLRPLAATKSFNPTAVAVNATSTLSIAINNANNVAVDSSFTDTLPPGLLVANPANLTNTCGGTVTAIPGSATVTFANATLPIGACAVTVNVSSATDNGYSNSVTVNSSDAGTDVNSTSSASLTVANPPTIAKAFGAATLPLNGTTSLTFTITSTNATQTLNGISFTDNLPAGLVVATPNGLSNTCLGTATAVAGASSASLSGGALAPGASCTVSLNVSGTTAGTKNNSVQVTSLVGNGNTANASLTVLSPPTISKVFGAATIPLNGSTSLSFTITNPNAIAGLTGVAVTDTLPAGMTISTPNGLTGSCGAGTITATAGTGALSLSGGTIAANASCTFSINISGTTAGSKANTSGAVTSTEGGTGTTSNTATLNVVAPPSIAKAFNPTGIGIGGTTSLTFTITNPAANTVPLTGVAFTDTLPTGLTVVNASAAACGGTFTATAPTGISLAGATIAASAQCTFSVTVTGAASGAYTNTTGTVTATNGGAGNTASASLTVAAPPTIAKAFGVATIPLNGSTSLTLTVTNPSSNTISLTGLAFTDSLPAGLVVATPNNLNSTCSGTATAVPGASSLSLAAATLAANASCVVSLNVTGTTAGVKNNSVQITSTEAGTGNTANASITVAGPATISKAFGAASIPLNGSTSLSFTLTNPNPTIGLTGVAFSDTLPAGLTIATPNGLSGTCGSGTITATAGTGVLSLSGGTIAASGSCTFSINVTGTTAGANTNTASAVTSTEGGTGAVSNTASLDVVAPPSIAKAFNPTGIAVNATTSLTFTITNPAANSVSLTGVAFTDTLPTGLTVPNASATVCGGTITLTSPTGIALTGATIAANSQCLFSVTVTGATSGAFTNTTGAVTSTNGGTGNTASANLSVAAPPTISKAFGAATIPMNGSTSVSFTIANPSSNAISLTGLAFTDNFPAGLVVATPSNLASTCSGTATAIAGAASASLAGATLAPNASCVVSLNVTGTSAGVKNNSAQVTSTEAGVGNTANASITVMAPPAIAKAFGAPTIPLSGSTSLTFTLTNPNGTAGLTGIAFSDALPAGLVVATPNGLTATCSGTTTAVDGSGQITLAAGTLAAGASCTIAVNVTGATGGVKNNTTGAITSIEGGTGGTATASVTVLAPDLTIVKTHTGNFRQGQTGATYAMSVSNIGAAPTTGTVTMVDALPAGLTATAIAGTNWACTLGTLTCTRADALAAGLTYEPITVTVNVAANAPALITNTATVSGGGDSSAGNNTATDATTVDQVADLTITKTHAGNFARGQGGSTYTLTVHNIGPGPTTGAVIVTDALPVGITASAAAGTNWSCTVTPVSCSRSDALAASASYDPITITVSVANSVGAQVTNVAAVSGGGELNTTNNTGTDVANINSGVPASITAADGTPQVIAGLGSSAPMSALVTDAGGFPVSGAAVTFTGGGLIFSNGSQVFTTTTNTLGIATAPGVHAGGNGAVDGNYAVSAAVGGVAQPAIFTINIFTPFLSANPSTLTFSFTTGAAASSQNVQVSSNPPGLTIVTSDASWLTLSAPGSGTSGSQINVNAPGTVSVTANPAGLSPGHYTAAVSFNGAGLTTSIAVVMDVKGPASLIATPTSLTFATVFGQPAPAAQTTQVTSGNTPVNITATASASWITVTAGSQTTPSILTVSVDPGSMAPGTYTGSVTVKPVTGDSLTIPVTLTIAPALSINSGGIINDASFLAGPGAPNAIMALFGKVACSTTPTVLVDGVAVEVLGATSGQINFTLPASVAGKSSVQVQVKCGSQMSDQAQISIAPVAPAIFTISQTGTGQGAILNQNYSVNGSSNAIARRSYLFVYGTGFGTYGATDANGLTPLSQTVTAFVGDVPAQVQFAGQAPGYTPGLQQINILIPDGAPSGAAVPIRLVIGGVSTQLGVTVAIQ